MNDVTNFNRNVVDNTPVVQVGSHIELIYLQSYL